MKPDIPAIAEIDNLCCTLLRGEPQLWPFAADERVVEQFVGRAVFHGVECLLHQNTHLLRECPAGLHSALREVALSRTCWELRNRQLTGAVLDALAAAGVDALVFKGAALAYLLYANPACRTRADSDVLIQPWELALATRALITLGYSCLNASEEIIYYQRSFCIQTDNDGEHCIDLHWQLNNSELLASLFTYERLRARSCRVPALSTHARAPGNVDALIITCLHSAVHEAVPYYVAGKAWHDGARLIWLYDIHLLTGAFDAAEWEAFCDQTQRQGLSGTCLRFLLQAQTCFATALPTACMAALQHAGSGVIDRYLDAGPVQRAWLDFKACGGWQRKIDYCGQLLFPPAAYMHGKYADAGLQWLPWLYLRRSGTGLLRRLLHDRQLP
ncbi:MAG: nucleotidyltransferase family protein [Pseudomonadota bacterium]